MCLHPNPIGEIPSETARVARAAFPKGTVVMRLRDEFSTLYQDEDFRALYPSKGQPALTPWRLALITGFQFLEHLSDRQAADAVLARIALVGLRARAPSSLRVWLAAAHLPESPRCPLTRRVAPPLAPPLVRALW